MPTASAHNLSNAGSPLPARNKQHSIDRGEYSNAEHYNDARSSGYDPESTPVRKSSTSSMPASPAAWQYETCDDDLRSLENATKLSTMRMKLEERRRRIEQDKRKIEMAVMRHQEKVSQVVKACSLLQLNLSQRDMQSIDRNELQKNPDMID